MSVKLNIHPSLYHFTDNQEIVEVNGNTVGECLDDLLRMYPRAREGLFGKHNKLLDFVEIYVNGETAYPEELAKSVQGGDEIHLTVMLAGG